MRIEDRIYTGLKHHFFADNTYCHNFMRIEDRIYTGSKLSIHAEYVNIRPTPSSLISISYVVFFDTAYMS
jgi:hypothetical protein